METAPLLVPLVILVPALGTFINFFWGAKMGERAAGYIAVAAAAFTFFVSMWIFGYLNASHGLPVVVDPVPFFNGWLRIGADAPVNMPWQFRVDTLTGNMLLVVTGVGTLIHIYSVGYIHGDPKATRFFAYLNMFLAFMLILVTGNNLLMMFVGWEGVGLCSFLLIGYWWDKKGETGWQNSNAARKAMILNRIGDFGILMAIFLAFWTFGTVDYYSAGEINSPCYALESAGYETELHDYEASSHSVCVGHHAAATEGEHAAEGEVAVEGEAAEHGTETEAEHGEAATEEHGEEVAGEHGGEHLTADQLDNSSFELYQLGMFAQAERLIALGDGETIQQDINHDGDFDDHNETRSRAIAIGPWTLDVSTVIGMIALFLLLGAAGKSAQIPLFVWLPDAMAGPTPVSALMHAATMVTAGVYLLVRCSTFLELVPEARAVVAVIGATTALVAGFIALGQWDIKRVLAFSTVSQLGFMVAAIGVGGYVAAMFHLTTHAVFKALLFLGSGAVIHGVEHGHHHVHEHAHHDDEHHDHDEHHEEEFDAQDMRNMGGLRKKLPFTFITYLIGTFGLMGLPFFAGFWSKDEILLTALTNAFFGGENVDVLSSTVALYVFGVLTVAAFFTTFYMWRQIQMVFYGEPRSEAANYAGGNSAWMIVPLVVLAWGTITVGFMNYGNGVGLFDLFFPESARYWYEHFLASAIPVVAAHEPLTFNWPLAIATSILLPAVAIAMAHSIYAGNKAVVDRNEEAHELGKDPLFANAGTRPAWVAANRRAYWDDLYHAVFLYPYERIGRFLATTLDWNFWHDYFHNNIIKKGFDALGNFFAKPVDAGVIDFVVNGTGRLINFFSGRSRGIQTGYVRTYAVALFVGVVVVIVLMLLPLLTNGS
jgi:NADH:ubiquinone oxidoreductase subunit 5 (subunit L)/multisubunit Na+/H+ antiporter MnhA subunit